MNQRINGSLNVKADDSNIFRLEVNEKHECIEIDTSDITISARIMKLFDGFETFKNEFKRREGIIEKMPDDVPSKYDPRLSTKDVEKSNAIWDFFQKQREMFDEVFGEDAAQKTFGKANRIDMFDQFAEQIKPYLKDMGITAENYQKSLIDKYSPKKSKRQ